NALPLVLGLVEPAHRSRVLEALVKDVRDHGNALTAGDVGYRYLLRALAEGDRSDVIFDINNQSDRPSYGYQLRQGATSLTEAWDAGRHSSQNHFMLGQIQEWFYHDLAGIRCDPDGPGFKKIIIKPALVGDLTWVNASYHSIHGPILSQWQRATNAVTLKVSIPANTTATIWVPTDSAQPITEGSGPANRSQHVQFLRRENGYALYQVDSGQYEFHSRRVPPGTSNP
ncbi:MAG TPA: alpha-L-rhamnosidase C-terminal domain-containing protein, partial [Candidatus Sulfotelmatobacter sp.]|nr:alpha-L-rhamnosidase C-terminal domain-containing protein [Candidatus Sulfotelmatobacter sp.]